MLISNYSSALTSSSSSYCRVSSCTGSLYYYQALEFNVSMDGNCTIVSNSTMDTYGYLYSNTFYPASPLTNVLDMNDDGGGNGQFMLSRYFQILTRYILVVTTYDQSVTGPFSIIATGLVSIRFSQIEGSNSTPPTTTSTPTVISQTDVTSQFSSALTSSSPMFCRTGSCSSSNYYYQAFLLNVSTAGSYSIMSNSSIDTYGYIYNNSFTPSDPSTNMITYDDDGAGARQFLLTIQIDTVARYILVATTYSTNVQGSFLIIANGPGSVGFILI
ncbi:unnamed protein product [Rotaria sp. Silwood1]|nr:unnamed protein product [Rotaria sp. Silwood1]